MGSTPSSGILSHGERTVERMDRGLAVAIFVKEGERLGISISKSLSGSKEEGIRGPQAVADSSFRPSLIRRPPIIRTEGSAPGRSSVTAVLCPRISTRKIAPL